MKNAWKFDFVTPTEFEKALANIMRAMRKSYQDVSDDGGLLILAVSSGLAAIRDCYNDLYDVSPTRYFAIEDISPLIELIIDGVYSNCDMDDIDGYLNNPIKSTIVKNYAILYGGLG